MCEKSDNVKGGVILKHWSLWFVIKIKKISVRKSKTSKNCNSLFFDSPLKNVTQEKNNLNQRKKELTNFLLQTNLKGLLITFVEVFETIPHFEKH